MISGLTGRRLYLDANVCIYGIEGFPRYEAVCRAILHAVDDKAIEAVTSELTLAEVLVRPIRDGLETVVRAYETLLRSDGKLIVAPITRKVLRESAVLRASLGGLQPDAIHVATAIEAGCSHLLTADRRLKTPARVGLVVLDDLLLPPASSSALTP